MDITQIFARIEAGNPAATSELLPYVYDELRCLAAARLANERPGHLMQATELVHDAFLRLVGKDEAPRWNSRAHFFAAAAEAMRRILVELARYKSREKNGGKFERREFNPETIALPGPPEELLDVHEALDLLSEKKPEVALLVKLRYFSGFTNDEAAEMLSISPRKASELWSYGRAWLADKVSGNNSR